MFDYLLVEFHIELCHALQGLTATIVRNTPANACYLGNFEMMKRAYCSAYSCSPNEIPGHIVLGAAGKKTLGHLPSHDLGRT